MTTFFLNVKQQKSNRSGSAVNQEKLENRDHDCKFRLRCGCAGGAPEAKFDRERPRVQHDRSNLNETIHCRKRPPGLAFQRPGRSLFDRFSASRVKNSNTRSVTDLPNVTNTTIATPARTIWPTTRRHRRGNRTTMQDGFGQKQNST